jgi:hypothetical protein
MIRETIIEKKCSEVFRKGFEATAKAMREGRFDDAETNIQRLAPRLKTLWEWEFWSDLITALEIVANPQNLKGLIALRDATHSRLEADERRKVECKPKTTR